MPEPPENPLRGIRACVFDAYGTLFDFASAAASCRDVLGDRANALTVLWRDKQLQYSWLRSLQGRYADFWQVTTDALDYTLETLGIADGGLRERLLNLYRTLDAFPEVPGTLKRLKAAGFTAAVLSNGSPAMLASAVAAARLGVAAEAIAFVSSNAWDAHAAAAFGMRVLWCNRYGQRRERLPGSPDHEIRTLAELPALLSA